MHPVSGIILAGGASRRMGRDKAWIEIEGRPLVERVVERLGLVCKEILLVTNHPEPSKRLGARLVSDTFPGKGSLGGIFSGLEAARFDRAIVVACDMPFLNAALLRYMLSFSAEDDVVIPSAPMLRKPRGSMREDSGQPNADRPTAKDIDLHPLHAVYSKHCLAPIKARLAADDLRMISFHPDVRVRVVNSAEVERFDPDHLSFFNVNTPEDLVLAESLAAQERPNSYDQC
jgi:molybdopterin-guanine dinucleotide biosynthesis protein A